MDRKLGDEQVPVTADLMCLRVRSIHTVGEVLAQPLSQRQHVRRPAKLRHVYRFLLVCLCGDGHGRRNLTNTQNDTGIRRIPTVGEHHARAVGAERFVGLFAVDRPGDHRDAVDVPFSRHLRVFFDMIT